MGGMMNPPPMGKNPNDPRQKIEKIFERKNFIVDSSKNDKEYENNNKKQCFELVKFVLEKDLNISPI